MNIQKVALSEANSFKGLFLDYIKRKKSINEFYNNYPDIGGFEKQIKEKKFPAENRRILVKSLAQQYENFAAGKPVKANLDLLAQENTYTITTGHQLNIFTGPLYFIYKIVTIINLSAKLKAQFPDKNFVPVYWMASEDHDFEEIQSFNLFGKKYTWETDQTGAVGDFSLDGIEKIFEALPEKIELFEKAYLNSRSLSDATRFFVNELFGQYGLVIIDAHRPELKSTFHPVIKDDLENHKANDLAGKTTKKLVKLGYQSQLYPRSINFFYLNDGLRERIYKDGEYFKVKNTDLKFSREEILDILEKNPEKFSPNVVLRPLYQETILPNLAYIGGPAEVAYWLQLKGIFDEYNLPFPILVPRNYALVVSKSLSQKVEKLGVKYKDLFMDFQELKVRYLAQNAENEISIEKETEKSLQNYECIKIKANKVDPSLEGFIAAEAAKAKKSLENIGKRIRKAEEKRQEVEINQLENIKNKLFPNGQLQERHDNFLNFFINNPHFIHDLVKVFDPLDFNFNVIIYNE